MNNLSERVQREFNEWKEKYNIPDHMEFEVKTLLKLQEEYDLVETGSNTTRTRESLLSMINRLHKDLMLKPKTNITKPMYIDLIKNNDTSGKVTIYYNGNITVLNNNQYSYKDYAVKINSLINPISKEKIEIYILIREDTEWGCMMN